MTLKHWPEGNQSTPDQDEAFEPRALFSPDRNWGEENDDDTGDEWPSENRPHLPGNQRARNVTPTAELAYKLLEETRSDSNSEPDDEDQLLTSFYSPATPAAAESQDASRDDEEENTTPTAGTPQLTPDCPPGPITPATQIIPEARARQPTPLNPPGPTTAATQTAPTAGAPLPAPHAQNSRRSNMAAGLLKFKAPPRPCG